MPIPDESERKRMRHSHGTVCLGLSSSQVSPKAGILSKDGVFGRSNDASSLSLTELSDQFINIHPTDSKFEIRFTVDGSLIGMQPLPEDFNEVTDKWFLNRDAVYVFRYLYWQWFASISQRLGRFCDHVCLCVCCDFCFVESISAT